jgi:dipeptidyl aminopeptidase/acylaminoacyl peptidase
MPAREDIQFASHGEILKGWLYPAKRRSSSSTSKGPAIVLAHGLGAVKEMRLDAYSERFQAQGYTCLVFDYRCNGESTGAPRGLVDVERQLEDWAIAIKYVRSLSTVDADRVGIFGSSFGGGNVIMVAARDPTIKAVISQCLFTSGYHSALTTGISVIPSLLLLGIRDYLFGTNSNPVTVPLVGVPGEGELLVLYCIRRSTLC